MKGRLHTYGTGEVIATDAPIKIGIIGHYGYGNLGDDTVVAILIKNIRMHCPTADLFGFSLNPADTEQRHGIKTFPIRRQSDRPQHRSAPDPIADGKPGFYTTLKQWLKHLPWIFRPVKWLKTSLCEPIFSELSFLRNSFHRLRGFDLLVVPGSSPLTDWWGGPWRHPYSMLSWSLLARIAGTEVVALSIGSERLDTRLGKVFCKWFLSLAQYRSFRDRYSCDAMRSLGLKGDNFIFPDQGFAALDVVHSNLVERTFAAPQEQNAKLTVGVNPVGKWTCLPPGVPDSWYQEYIENLSALLLRILKRGHRVAFCPSDTSHDPPFVQQIMKILKASYPDPDLDTQIIQDPILTVEDLILRIQRCDIMIASRFHGVVLAFVLQKPVLAISYSRKIGDLMSECGQADYHRGMDRANVDDMNRLFCALEQNRHSIGQHLGFVVSEYRFRLAEQYRNVFQRFRQGRQYHDV